VAQWGDRYKRKLNDKHTAISHFASDSNVPVMALGDRLSNGEP